MRESLDSFEIQNPQRLSIEIKRHTLLICKKKDAEKKNSELDKMKEDLDNVKGELGEIKGLLSTLVQKLNN